MTATAQSPQGTTRAAVFLRAVNVGGRRVTNAQLVTALEGSFASVAAFQAAGNLVVDAAAGSSEVDISTMIEATLGEALGFAVPAFVRTIDELRNILSREAAIPLFTERERAAVHIAFLRAIPEPSELAAIASLAGPDDVFMVEQREVYWHRNGGLSESPVTDAQWRRAMPEHTMRTAATLERLVAKFG